ncbi:hypothetical protein JCM8202_001320 [Rhodotorula sphaerocarpa]
MQSYRLRRRLRSHYSLLIPFPPLPFAFPPLSPASPVAEPLQSPALPSRGSRSTSSQTVRPGEHPFPPAPFPLREDGGEEDAPLEPDLEGDQPATGLQPRSSKSTSVAGRTAVRPVAFGPEEAFLVDFSRTYDPLNHQCWSPRDRIATTAILCLLVLFSGAASSINAFTAVKASHDLGVSKAVVNLDTALFLIGFGVAAPIAAPLSELAGRYAPAVLMASRRVGVADEHEEMRWRQELGLPRFAVVFAALELGPGWSSTIAARCILRFFSGCFASSPLSNAAAGIGDLWTASERTVVFPIFAAFGLTGPCLGPVIGGIIAQSSLKYRWTDWLQAICHVRALERRKSMRNTLAAAVRARNRDPRYMTALEIKRLQVPYRRDFMRTLARPFEMLVLEPIVVCFLAYLTLVFVVLFGALVAYPLIFHPFGLSLEANPGRLGLLFLAIPVGLAVCTGIIVPLAWDDFERCRYRAVTVRPNGGRVVRPEVRLRTAMLGTWAVPAGLLWTAWTLDGRYSIFHPLGGQALFGAGFLICFASSYGYLIDSYAHAAASALSAVTFLRYIISGGGTLVQGGAVLFTPPLYRRLTPPWALTLLACLAFVLSFVPWIFYFAGPRIRSWSRWTLHS